MCIRYSERLDRVADARATRPVIDRSNHVGNGAVNISPAELAGYTGEPRAEHEHLNRIESLFERMDESQQHARIPIHRPRDVADQDQRSHAPLTIPPLQLQRHPTLAE